MKHLPVLLYKEIRLSLGWFFANLLIVSSLMGLGVYNAHRGRDVAIVFVFLTISGLFVWSMVAGMATYFLDRQGRVYEFINTLPVSRVYVLLSKGIWLWIQATGYFLVFLLGSFVILQYMLSGRAVEIARIFQQADLHLSLAVLYAKYLVMLNVSLIAAFVAKDMPAKWFFAVLMFALISWVLGWVDPLRFISPDSLPEISGVEGLRNINSVMLLSEVLRFLIGVVLLILCGLWAERHGL